MRQRKLCVGPRFSKHFAVSELACHDGTPVPQQYYSNAKEICERVEKLRTLVGTAVTVNSGYRTPDYNKKIGGELHSFHLTASALDIRVIGWEPKLLAELWEGLIRLGLIPDGGLGVYESFVHVDLGPPRRWNG